MPAPCAASDEELRAIATKTVTTIADVIASLTALDLALPDSDGLKWFNWLYLKVTEAVDLSIGAKPPSGQAPSGQVWNCPDWLTRLDVVFAGLYLDALAKWLTPGEAAPKCWQVLFRARNDARLARIQFALAGVNAHIDHDLPGAIVQTCREFSVEPVHLSPQYRDYTAINDLLDGIIDAAKKELLVGLLGDNLPSLNLVENLVAMWGLRGTREFAWTNAELLWHAQNVPGLAGRLLDGLDDSAELAGRGLLAPVGV